MKQGMNVLVVGFGSIGRRHVLNLINLDCIDEIIVYTKVKDNITEFIDKKIRFIDSGTIDLSVACENIKIDFAIIANQTYKHIDTAIILAEKRIDLFIEKPISHNLEKIDSLKSLAKRKKIKIFIAYNMRFLPAIKYVKDQLDKGALGDLYFARIEAGYYLPLWRKNIEYTDSYSSKKEFGGGVALDLSHEIDYMRYFFGDPEQWKVFKSKVSDLKINSNDVFEGIYEYSKGFICSVHLDYLQNKLKRQIKIVGSKGYIICDLAQNCIEISTDSNKDRIEEERFFKIDGTYIEELQAFIKEMSLNGKSDVSIDDGIKILKLLEDSNV